MAKTKDLTKPKVKEKIIKLPVSKFINSKFRDYSLYVLTSRGIPSFYDALTPVQRFILKNTPTSYVKTLSVIGSAIKDHYHHGDCLHYDTKINLADGTQITIGKWFEQYPDAVLLVKSIDDNENEIISIGHSPRIGQETTEYLEIELESGEIIKCTKNHPFYVNGKWIKAEDLTENDDIFELD
jgi:DNA gyrase subunit A